MSIRTIAFALLAVCVLFAPATVAREGKLEEGEQLLFEAALCMNTAMRNAKLRNLLKFYMESTENIRAHYQYHNDTKRKYVGIGMVTLMGMEPKVREVLFEKCRSGGDMYKNVLDFYLKNDMASTADSLLVKETSQPEASTN